MVRFLDNRGSKNNFVASPTPLAKDPEALLDSLEQIRKDDKEPFDPLEFLNKRFLPTAVT